MNARNKTYLVALLLLAWAAAAPEKAAGFPIAKKAVFPSAEKGKDPLERATRLLKSAKENHDDVGMAHAYKTIMHLSPASEKTAYADSLIASALRTKRDVEIGPAYLTKGALHYSRREFEKALNCYLVADSHLAKTGDLYNSYKSRYAMATIKQHLGYYDEAISSFKECVQYFENENDQAYLNSLHFLSLVYLRNGQNALSKSAAETGLNVAKNLAIPEMVPYFRQVLGSNMYFDKNYGGAVTTLSEVLPFFINRGDFANESASHYYIGRSLWIQGQKDSAIAHLEQVDRIFYLHKHIRPELMKSYDLILEFYISKEDSKNAAMYTKRLDNADAAINREFKHLASAVHLRYDAVERKKLIRKIGIVTFIEKISPLAIFSAVIFTLCIIYMKKHNKKVKASQNLTEDEPASEIQISTAEEPAKVSKSDRISPEKVAEVLSKLKAVIVDQKIFEKDLTILQFAKELGLKNETVMREAIKRHWNMGYEMFIRWNKITIYLNRLRKDPALLNQKFNGKDHSSYAKYQSPRKYSDSLQAVIGLPPYIFMPAFLEHLAKPGSELTSLEEIIKEVKEDPKTIRLEEIRQKEMEETRIKKAGSKKK